MSYLDILVTRSTLFLVAIATIGLLAGLAPTGGWYIPASAIFGSLAYLFLASSFVASLFWLTSLEWKNWPTVVKLLR